MWKQAALPVLAVALATTGSTQAAVVDSSAKGPLNLVFKSDRDGDYDVYSAGVRGRVANLTHNHSRDDNAMLASAGSWIAFRRGYSASGLANGVLMRTDTRRAKHFRGDPVAFSPNSRWLAVSAEDDAGRFYLDLVSVATGAVRHFGRGEPTEFSPDGRLLAYSSPDNEGVLDVATGKRRVLGEEEPMFSPSWKRFAFWGESDDDDVADLLVADTAAPRTTRHVVARLESNQDPLWLDDDHFVIETYGSEHDDLLVIDAVNGARRTVPLGQDGCCITWSPGRDRFTYLVGGDLMLGSISGDASRQIQLPGGARENEWSPSGRRLAVATDTELFVVDVSRAVPLARRLVKLRNIGTTVWAPDESAIAVEARGELFVVRTADGAMRRLTAGGNNEFVGWVRGPRPPNAAAFHPRRPPIDIAGRDGFRSPGKIFEIASAGSWVAAIVDDSRLDCEHVAAWSAADRRVIRFEPVRKCDYAFSYLKLSLSGTRLRWTSFYCGNYCYLRPFSADVRRPGSLSAGDEEGCDCDSPGTRPAAPKETRRGVSLSVRNGTIVLRRSADAKLVSIAPPGGVVDAELENAGLFYAYNVKGALPGRVVFIPFARLFR